jgi:hypothetical protein
MIIEIVNVFGDRSYLRGEFRDGGHAGKCFEFTPDSKSARSFNPNEAQQLSSWLVKTRGWIKSARAFEPARVQ